MATNMLRVCCRICSYQRINGTATRALSSDAITKISSDKHDKLTHTGQSWAEDDPRMVRFMDGKEKQVNPRFAIDLIAEQPPMASKKRIVSCDGGGGPLGHPKVYINLDQPGNHTCGYCGLRFYKEDHH